MKNNTQIVKIGKLGTLTLCLPEMEGRYMLIEQGEGTITLRAVGLDLHGAKQAGVAAQNTRGELVLIAPQGAALPRA